MINFLLLNFFILFSCKNNQSIDYLKKYKKPDKKIFDIIAEKDDTFKLHRKNYNNLKNDNPFYIIREESRLYLDRPSDKFEVSNNFISLKFGDILYPVMPERHVTYFFYVKTINDEYGWIFSNSGISVNYNEDPNLHFFSKDYYLKRYKDAHGEIDNSNLIILAKNVVPFLLGNYESVGWFYPFDFELALKLSKFCVDIAVYRDTFFYSADAYDWRVNEIVIANNLLADSYQKLKFYDKAEKVQDFLIRWYFWARADNTQIGGLNSVVKLEKLYLEQLKDEGPGSEKYLKLQNKIIDTILIVGNKFNDFTVIDKKWHLTAAEWVLDILLRELSRKEFYDFANKIKRKTSSTGYYDMVNLYVAIEMYKEGREVAALKILTSTKPRHHFKRTLRINDWLSANKIIPDSIIYQYNF